MLADPGPGRRYLAALVLSLALGACSEPAPPEIDLTQAHAGAAQAEEAFLSGEPQRVLAVMTEESAGRWGARVEAVKDQLAAYGEAIKSRQVKVASDLYVEYTFSSGGKTYSLAFAKVEEGQPWKLVRF